MKLTEKLTLTNEDNMELMARTPDKFYDLAIVDPPYGNDTNVEIGTGEYSKKHFKNDSKNWDNRSPNKEYFKELFRVSSNQIIWGGNFFNLPASRGWVCWYKTNELKGRDFSEFELAYSSFSKPARLFECRPFIKSNHRIHPTQKPVALYKWLLQNYAKEGDKILDTHLGSMSIAIACHDMGFELTGCELDPDYYEAGIKRVKNHISQLQIF